MPVAKSNGIELHFESFGPADASPILLIMGLGAQQVRWRPEFCNELAGRGFRVIRFDNRDCGMSTRCHAVPLPDIGGLLRGVPYPSLPYTLDTMAADTIGLLDALAIDQAHIVGASMGGAIAQIVAARHPARVQSLTCIMSSSGNPQLPPPSAQAAAALFRPLPASRDRESIVADAIARWRAIGSPAYPTPEANLKQMFGEEYDRGFYPQGVVRQLAAVLSQYDRRRLLGGISCPSVVLHGRCDPLTPLACGEDVVQNIPNAVLWAIDGMGHDLPPALTPIFADAICAAARCG